MLLSNEIPRWCFIALAVLLRTTDTGAQTFYFGADLSYVREMEDCGAVYKVDGEAQDPYSLFKDYGCNLVRLRLWHTPSWYDQLNQGIRYSDYADVHASMMRAKSEGMDVLLDFHLSDTWADPGHQVAPAAWTAVLDDLPVLQDSLYLYIYSTLQHLGDEGLLPDLVQIGNETNRGILLSQEVNDAGWTLDWPRNSALFNRAISAVRDVEALFLKEIKIALHIANPSEAVWYFEQFQSHGVIDFDMIGLSYYWPWHHHTLETVGDYISTFRNSYPDKEVILLETGMPWTNTFADQAHNLLNESPPGYSPPSPENQKQWLVDLTQTVIDHGGSGVVYWEPAWVSTGCWTQWEQGSHWENCAFFDFDHELISDGGITWMANPYDFNTRVRPSWSSSDDGYRIVGNGEGLWVLPGNAGRCGGKIHLEWISTEGKVIYRKSMWPEWVDGRLWVDHPALAMGVYGVRMTDDQNCGSIGLIFKP